MKTPSTNTQFKNFIDEFFPVNQEEIVVTLDQFETTSKVPSDTVVGQYIQHGVTGFLVVVSHVYTMGYMTGEFIHNLNNKLTNLVINNG